MTDDEIREKVSALADEALATLDIPDDPKVLMCVILLILRDVLNHVDAQKHAEKGCLACKSYLFMVDGLEQDAMEDGAHAKAQEAVGIIKSYARATWNKEPPRA